MASSKKLLFVLAHPGDETFGMGGTVAFYAKSGVEVHLICTTRGELGEAPPDMRGHASIAELRVAELECAASILGIHAVHLLEYSDSGVLGSSNNSNPDTLACQPIVQVARDIARHIRIIRPQVIVTFDPIGDDMHPDHVATHHATVRAFHMAFDAQYDLNALTPHLADKLYYHTYPRQLLRFRIRAMALLGQDPTRAGKNNDIDLTKFARVDFPIHARIPVGSMAKVKAEAFKCHSSQLSGEGGLVGLFRRYFNRTETYMRAIPEIPPTRIEKDLFEGVCEN